MSNELETLEMALSFQMNPDDGSPLDAATQAKIEARIAELTGGGAAPQQDDMVLGAPDGLDPIIDQNDLSGALARIQQQLAGITQGGGIPQQAVTLESVLTNLDPRDSDAALALLDWLITNGRLQNIGTINGGGYLWHYAEPKGSTKEGYMPGGTKGGRMVDEALQKAKESGATVRKTGMCDKCYSAVVQQDDGAIVLDDETADAACTNGGTHTFHG